MTTSAHELPFPSSGPGDRPRPRSHLTLVATGDSGSGPRYLLITDDGHGGVRLLGRGTAEDGALLRAALAPAASRRAGSRPSRQPSRERLWEALLGLARTGGGRVRASS